MNFKKPCELRERVEETLNKATSYYRGVGIIRKGIIRKALDLSGKHWNYPEIFLVSDNYPEKIYGSKESF